MRNYIIKKVKTSLCGCTINLIERTNLIRMYTIEVDQVSKKYALYSNKKDILKEVFSLKKNKYHKEFYALEDISFQVDKGECVGIIGLNGSGKSTLLKIITGVLTQTSGNVSINGKVSALLELGAGFNPEYTGLENIYLNTMLMGYTRKETEEKLKHILDFADIGDFINQPVKVYSSGMFVRLAFAIAITIEPEVLIIDEALSVGDVFFQQKCYKKIKELAGKSTVLIVSHDLNAMTKFCKRIIVMDKGKIKYDGNAQEAITTYFKIKHGKYSISHNNDYDLDMKDFKDFLVPDKNNYSGNMNVIIKKYLYTVNDNINCENCKYGDNFKIYLLVESIINLDNLIVGFQVRDKYSNEIFGETSLTSGYNDFRLNEGLSLINLEFTWPEVREGNYFITLGIGNGVEVLNQIEECWINNAIHVTASVEDKVIYGVFNCPVSNFSINRI
jgi:teichoic acid transport system ATP-binding protein